MKTQIESLLRETKRERVEELITFLSNSDFYKAPSSTRFHFAKESGLVEHTLNVVRCATNLMTKYVLTPVSSVIISSICHDLCKVNFYTYDNESPTDAQLTYLRSLCLKASIRVPENITKTYASVCIDHLKSMRKLPLPAYVPSYKVNDQFPLGHGEKSLFIASRYIVLTEEEALAIRWHMGMSDISVHSSPGMYAYQEAVKKSKLVSILQLADQEASFLMEAEDD